ncbi:MAG: hypothetical protein U1F36_10070 [Planctomycetota bacterium]
MTEIAAAVLDRAVDGVNLRPAGKPGATPTLRDQLGPGPTILAFLRHLG